MLTHLLPLTFVLLLTCGILAGPTPARADDAADTRLRALIEVPGSQWRTAQPIYTRMQKHSGNKPLRLTVHYTDEPRNFTRSLDVKLQHLFSYSLNVIAGTKRKLWGDIPYHFFIDANGKLGEGRRADFMPDSNTSYDRDGHIAIVIEGNQQDGLGSAQKQKLYQLLEALQAKYRVPGERVGTHKDYAQTDCPGPVIQKAVVDYKRAHPGLPAAPTPAQNPNQNQNQGNEWQGGGNFAPEQ